MLLLFLLHKAGRATTPSYEHASLEAICSWLAMPLQKAGIDPSLVQEE